MRSNTETISLEQNLLRTIRGGRISLEELDVQDPETAEAKYTIRFSGPDFKFYLREKLKYLRSLPDSEELSDEQIQEWINNNLTNALIVFLSEADLREGLYQESYSQGFERVAPEEEYSRYKDLLIEITGDQPDTIPAIPDLLPEFVSKVGKSEDLEIPSYYTARTIVEEHIEYLREQTQAREGVKLLSSKLENSGVDARTATSIANDLEPYLKSDAELNNNIE